MFKGTLGIDYGQFYITLSSDEDVDMDPDASFEGQENGICGAKLDDMIYFVTGIQSGSIEIDVDLHESAPVIDETYGEIIEVSFNRSKKALSLCEWGWEKEHALDIPEGIYRLRYSIDGMDKDHSNEAIEEDEDLWESPVPGQRHLIQIWPDENAKDKVIKQTSEKAKYWHIEQGSWRK